MNKTRFIFLCLCILQLSSFAQKEGRTWYFGKKAGLDFSTSPPTILTNGQLISNEGVSSISDALGNLLFYTNGDTVFNKTHFMMANGFGLMGNQSTTQSALIIKRPGNSSIYYIFTQDDVGGPNGFRYSEVDLALAAGLGSVTVKNVPLFTPSCEKLAATNHCNGDGVWVMSHDWGSNNFRAYLVTSAGVGLTPVISGVGSVLTGTATLTTNQTLGQMKFSPDGKKMGHAINDAFIPVGFELFDFDPATGILSNSLSLGNSVQNYGCEFSSDGTKFYGTSYVQPSLMQWDLCAGSATAIAASQYSFAAPLDLTSMQLAPDGKIYVCQFVKQYLGVINSPNNPGSTCNYVNNGQSIAPRMSVYGLQNLASSYFKPTPTLFTFTVSCGTASFTAPFLPGPLSSGCTPSANLGSGITWVFGDPASGPSNTSTLNNPTHMYSTPGTYSVQLISKCPSDTTRSSVIVLNTAPVLSISGAMSICQGEKRTYTVTGANSYTWHSGANTSTIVLNPTVTASYSVSGTGTNACPGFKQFTVTVSKCTDIETLAGNEESFSIYPNPSNGKLFVETAAAVKIKILDKAGVVQLDVFFEAGKHDLDISHLSSGIYVVHSTTKNGTSISRLVKID